MSDGAAVAAELPAWTREPSALAIAPTPEPGDLAPERWIGRATGRGVRVAIVDTGVDASHPALGGAVDRHAGAAVELDEHGTPQVIPGPHDDLVGHGTACAGIVHQLAPEATIVSVRVLGATMAGKGAALVEGLAWAVEQGFDVVNLSLGTPQRDWAPALQERCDEAYFAGCFVVTAASNIARPTFPSLSASVASVACSLTGDPWQIDASPRPPTEFLARGLDVDVAWAGGDRRRMSGNSYAAPHVAGMAALIRSAHPGLRPFQVKTALWELAVNVRAARAAGGPAR